MIYPLLLGAVARLSILLLTTLTVAAPCSAAEPALSLAEALRIATRDSALLAAQGAAIDAAQEGTVSARELPDPKLRLGIDNLPVDGRDRYSLSRDFMTMRKIGVAQDFPRTEKREIKGRRAEQQLAREQAMLLDTRTTLRRDVAALWMERYYAEQMGKVIDEQYAEASLQRDALQAGLASGKAQAAEVLAVQLSLQSLLDRRAEFDKQSARAKAMLARWLGGAVSRPLAGFTETAAQPNNLETHVAHHPHLQSLDRQIDIAQAEADLAKAAVKPDWGLELSYQQRGAAYSNMVSLQLSIDLPLFPERRQNRETAAKLAQVEQARALREDSLRLHLAEATAARADWEAASVRLKRFDSTLLPLARQRVELALATYRGGQGSLSAVLDARRMALDLRLQQLQLAAEQGRAYAQLLYFLPEEPAK